MSHPPIKIVLRALIYPYYRYICSVLCWYSMVLCIVIITRENCIMNKRININAILLLCISIGCNIFK